MIWTTSSSATNLATRPPARDRALPPFCYDKLVTREKLNLDLFWLKDDSLADVGRLPAPDVIAAGIVDNREAALERFRGVAEELKTG